MRILPNYPRSIEEGVIEVAKDGPMSRATGYKRFQEKRNLRTAR